MFLALLTFSFGSLCFFSLMGSSPDAFAGLFGNVNLRFVGHAPEALDRVIIEGGEAKQKAWGDQMRTSKLLDS